MVAFKNAFISYGRADSKAFAIQLNQRLTDAGLAVWFDAEDIPFGIDYQDEIDAGIINADNFLYVISPHSVNSPYCDKELALALEHNKRIIPLMHVEEISKSTWQTRNSGGTDEEWHAYQAKGLHSSHVNLNPAVGRINWIFFNEGNNFEPSTQALLEVIWHHQSYTRQHTEFLSKALSWEEYQRQDSYLLTPQDSEAARGWLQTQFLESLPPCTPTDLHCDFITESLKASNQGMTHVFLSYSEDDLNYQRHLRSALMRRGFTVWSNTTDIRTGDAFKQAIYHGIEKADTIVFLVSSHSLDSTYCQDELAYGMKYNKRIIPVLLKPMQIDTLPNFLQSIQFIEGFQQGRRNPKYLSEHSTDNPFSNDAIAQIIRALYDHADYYTQHKELLVKALAWDRRDRPNDLVLRGQEFVEAEAWWEISQQTTIQPPPTRLHRAFIKASQAQNRFFDAFISYGRADSLAFASHLHERLLDRGLNVWFDQQDIPVGVDFQAQIDDGIERSHNFIFIIAPHAVHSPYCLKEIELAVRFNKRIIPLMHVEEIEYETWQQRHPNQPSEGWDTYKATGKHSSFTAMHPDISKINWIFFRENVDSFDVSLNQLTTLIHQHERYVRQHTLFLTQALEWQRCNYPTSDLLTGENRRQAKKWLHTKFQDQPPCSPTVVHGEFIAASLKQANNQMTDVFLCYSEGDRLIAEGRDRVSEEELPSAQSAQSLSLARSIRSRLVLEGFTVWDYTTDIQSGESIQAATRRGMETADTLLFLLTNDTLKAPRCLQELEYALSLNKRIIPIALEKLAVSPPDSLDSLNVMDISHEDPAIWQVRRHGKTQDGLSSLFKTLQQNEAYYRAHKRLLAIALKWERQQHNPTVLLRGNTLKQYDAWLQVARQRPQHPPIELQTAFIEASKALPPSSTLDVFIIYAPEDFEFVRTLNETLQIQNKTTWFDETVQSASIQDMANIEQNELNEGIEQCENIVFVVSPSAIKDPRCIRELNYAHEQNKRIVPILYREILSVYNHPVLDQISWIDFQPGGDFSAQFGTLFRQLESDPAHIRPHTRLLVRSREWDEADRDKSYLLRGKELQASLDWLIQAEGKTPAPTHIQREFIAESQALPFRKLKRRSIVLTSVLSAGLIFGMRLFGLLLPLELWAYDTVLQLKSDEPQDDRFLIVQVDDESGRWLREKMKDGTYTPGIGTVPEAAMAEAITYLQSLEPSLIGLDFYRDFKADPEMAEVLSNSENLIGLCKAEERDSEITEAAPGYEPPAEVPLNRIGFNDFAIGSGNFLRRHLIKDSSDSQFCPTTDSFSLQLARRYLGQHGINYTNPWDEDGDGGDDVNFEQDLQFGNVRIPNLLYGRSGAYPFLSKTQDADLAGYQTLINFRTHRRDARQFALSVPLKAVLEEQISPEDVRDRIVIIGYVDESDRNADFYNTPHGLLSGVVMQGQLTSQLISRVMDGRSMIWWLPAIGDLLWMVGCSLASGFLVWGIVRPRRLIAGSVGLITVLIGSCTIVMVVSSGWLPLIPSLMAGGLAGAVTAIRNRSIRRP